MARNPIRIVTAPKFPTTLKKLNVDPGTLYRVGRRSTGEPYFGKWNSNRFDDPNPDEAARFGTCYLGQSLAVAVAETILHDRIPVKVWFNVSLDVIMDRYVVEFTGAPLILADLTGAELKRLGGNAALSGSASYNASKNWSACVHRHNDRVDGFVYMSRHKNDEKAIVLFDRAASKLRMKSAIPLHLHPVFGRVALDLYIRCSDLETCIHL
jgi:hypothetical protein